MNIQLWEIDMFLMEFVLALLIALILSIIFVYGFRRPGPWPNFLVFFIIIFLAAWAGGLWINPIGPSVRGMFWLPFLLAGIIFALLLAAATPPPAEQSTTIVLKTKEQAKKEERIKTALNLFLWILIIALTVFIIVAYLI